MFERQQVLEKAQEYRGPATRFFGPIESASDAALVLREMCVSLLWVAVLVLVTAFRTGWLAVGVAGAIALPAVLLITQFRLSGSL
jgi:uncharacterized membrane protein (DUF485 family)